MSFSTVGLPDSADFFCNVDADRAPCDAAAAPDTARNIKLVDPGRQLVCHPLPISGKGGWRHAAAVDVGMIGSEAGIPAAPAFGMIAGEIRYIFDGAAETCGTDHRAVGAGQATSRDVFPA